MSDDYDYFNFPLEDRKSNFCERGIKIIKGCPVLTATSSDIGDTPKWQSFLWETPRESFAIGMPFEQVLGI